MRTTSIIGFVALLGLGACGPKDTPIENPVDDGATDAGEEVGATVEEERVDAQQAAKELKKQPLHVQVNTATEILRGDDEARYPEAKAILDAALKEAADDPVIHYNLGIHAVKIGDEAAAKERFQKALDLDPTFGPGWLQLGVQEERAENLTQAIAMYRTGMQKAPENMDLRVALVGVLRKQGRDDEAIREAKEALRIDSNSLGIYNNLGLLYLEQGDLALAKFVYQKALNFIPAAQDNAYIHTNLGWIYVLREEIPFAKHHLGKAVELDPDLLPALIYMSYLHMQNQNFEEVVKLLERAYEQDPDNHSVVLNLGIAYRGTNELEKAKEMYRKALELQPENIDPWFNLGIVHGDYEKDYEKAIEAFQKYVDGGGEQAEVATTYISDLEQEKEKAERRKKRDEERKRREQERLERQKAAEAAEAAGGTEEGDGSEGGDATEEGAPDEEAGGEEAAPAGETPAEEGE